MEVDENGGLGVHEGDEEDENVSHGLRAIQSDLVLIAIHLARR